MIRIEEKTRMYEVISDFIESYEPVHEKLVKVKAPIFGDDMDATFFGFCDDESGLCFVKFCSTIFVYPEGEWEIAIEKEGE